MEKRNYLANMRRKAAIDVVGLAALFTTGCADIPKYESKILDGKIVSEPVIVHGTPNYLQFNVRETKNGNDRIIQVTYQNDKDDVYLAESVLTKETRKGDPFKMISNETKKVIKIPLRELGQHF